MVPINAVPINRVPMPEHDQIELRGIELLAICGVLPEEQARRQPFIFDVDIELDLGPASDSDELDDTVDYGAVIAEMAVVAETERFTLLERMAGRMAELVLAYPLVDAVVVTARKQRPPVPQHVDTTGVRVRRQRS